LHRPIKRDTSGYLFGFWRQHWHHCIDALARRYNALMDIALGHTISLLGVGINVGAFLAPLVCGTLGEEPGWHYGFAAAGFGMTIALVVYLYAMPMLPPDEMQKAKATGLDKKPLDRNEWRAILALIVLFLPTTLFWATYEQQGNTIALWADQHTVRSIDFVVWQSEIPVTWFQAFNPFMIFTFTPLSHSGHGRPSTERSRGPLRRWHSVASGSPSPI
jgi:POT family proton-dependent oligopeptide transporter